ncbi:MAG: hypothetical protein HQL46_06865 [Gammaproteobacteria bacterium]|nr:hypothetical protein [Gammaproteobacteria bacterium]
MKNYTIFFLGEPKENISIDELKVNLMRLFKLDENGVEKLFTGSPVIIKKNVPEDKARSYEKALLKAGAKVVLKEGASVNKETIKKTVDNAVTAPTINSALSQLTSYNAPQQADISEANKEESEEQKTVKNETGELSMLPANAGSLEEFNHHEVVEIPDIEHLSMSEAQQGDLEEFARKTDATDLPDITNLNCIDNEELIIEDKPTAENDIEVGHISMTEVNTGSLEEFAKHESATIPDISHLKAEEH